MKDNKLHCDSEINDIFQNIRKNVMSNLNNGGDGCRQSERIVNKSKYDIKDIINISSIEIDDETIEMPV